jgi:release factor glutamine methyltransferase
VELLVSNPPYVGAAEWEGVERQVREYEPREALVAGPVGLEGIERLARGAGEVVARGGWLVLEVGFGQAGAVREMLRSFEVEGERDLAGIERVVCGRRR